MNFTKTDLGMTLIGPAVLGGILGFLAYLAWDAQTKSLVAAVLFMVAGIFLVSVAAYGFRRFLMPHDKKSMVD